MCISIYTYIHIYNFMSISLNIVEWGFLHVFKLLSVIIIFNLGPVGPPFGYTTT